MMLLSVCSSRIILRPVLKSQQRTSHIGEHFEKYIRFEKAGPARLTFPFTDRY